MNTEENVQETVANTEKKAKPVGIKILLSGFENSGKTTLCSQLEDVFIVNFDRKHFTLPNVDFTEILDYKPNYKDEYEFLANKGLAMKHSIIENLLQKLKKYKEVYGKLPKTIVFDTVTHLDNMVADYCIKNFKGGYGEAYLKLASDVDEFNEFIEQTLIAKGINVVIVAHTEFDKDKELLTIPTNSKRFRNVGSWTAAVNESIFIRKTPEEGRVIILKSNRYPVRSTIDEFKGETEVQIELKDFNFNDYLNKRVNVSTQLNSRKF